MFKLTLYAVRSVHFCRDLRTRSLETSVYTYLHITVEVGAVATVSIINPSPNMASNV